MILYLLRRYTSLKILFLIIQNNFQNITDGIDLLMSSTTPSGPYARDSNPRAVPIELSLNARESDSQAIPIELNLSYFVDQDNSQGFHTYPGSLTTPGKNGTFFDILTFHKIPNNRLSIHTIIIFRLQRSGYLGQFQETHHHVFCPGECNYKFAAFYLLKLYYS